MWTLRSGAHRLRSIDVFVKRDDDLGGVGANGSKLRKWAAVIPWLQHELGAQRVVVAGTRRSNNIAAAATLLPRFGLMPHLLLMDYRQQQQQQQQEQQQQQKQQQKQEMTPNELIWKLAVRPENVSTVFVGADDDEAWLLEAEVQRVQRKYPGECVVGVPMGAAVPAALKGGEGLAEDVCRNAAELMPNGRAVFDHVFVDAGTGTTAVGMMWGLWKARVPSMVHVVLLADDREIFLRKSAAIEQNHSEWQEYLRNRVILHRPPTAQSFGSVNATVLDCVGRWAREGLLLDPLYSAKLMLTVEHELCGSNKHNYENKSVMAIISGGTASTFGFARQLLSQPH